jgi:ectoine hydroxylase-related dioxygenase (phytanoyl-CoA dioxygenase family)
MSLTPRQVEFFQENGYLILGKLFAEEELDALRRRAEWIASGDATHVPEQYRQVEPLVAQGERAAEDYVLSLRKLSHLAWYDDVMLAHARDPRITDRVAALLGPDLKLYQDQLFMKPPHVGSRQKYHQDQPLGFYIDPPELMTTCWLALEDATLENGCLRVLPGTHQSGVSPVEVIQEYERRAVEEGLPEEVPLELTAGVCSLHHGHLLHCSTPNLSGKRRRGYATHYVSARCRYTGPEPLPDFPLARGQALAGCL